MTRSTAGTTEPGMCGWLRLLAVEPVVVPSVFCTAAGLVTTYDPRTHLVGAPLPRIAALVGQHRDTVRANIRTLTGGGWLALARASAGGRGRGSLYRLRQPDLLAGTDLAGGGFSPKTRLSEGGLARPTHLVGGGLSPETDLAGGGFTPPHPPGTGTGWEGTPSPLKDPPFTPLPDGPARDVAIELEASLPHRLRPHARQPYEKLLVVLASLLEDGWTARQIVQTAGYDLPPDAIRTPARFVRARFEGRRPPRAEDTPAPDAWRRTSAERLSDERRAEHYATALAGIKGAS